MANHKSAKKRAKQNIAKRLRNKVVKTKVKNAIKKFHISIKKDVSSEINVVLKELNNVKSVIDRASKKGTFHKKTASRKISRLSKLANKLNELA